MQSSFRFSLFSVPLQAHATEHDYSQGDAGWAVRHGHTGSGPFLKDYPWDVLFTFRGVLHGRKTFDGRITTNGLTYLCSTHCQNRHVQEKEREKPDQ